MELSRQKVVVGATIAASGATLGATLFRPSGKGVDAQGVATPVASPSQIKALTASGTIHLAELGPMTRSSPIGTLSGGSVSITTPAEWPTSSVTSYLLAESDEGVMGFQGVPRGKGLYAYAPDFGLTLEGHVTLGEGVLAQYAVDDDTDGDLFFTLWQGPHNDLITTDYRSLDTAVAALSGLAIADTQKGAALSPKPGRFNNFRVVEETLSVEFGPFLARVENSSTSSAAPGWPGKAGQNGDFYRIGDVEAPHQEILYVSSTAAARLVEWKEYAPDHAIADAKIDALMQGFDISWHTV